ncbi:hypothetical protein RB195_019390 [Necator americanus]|uniref:Protein kinase domain-containing protein n=1 Tax=Necator americanus TaxID=51031 RepID=A0ABR1CDX7_NECAM
MHSLLVLVALSTLLVAMSVQQIDQQNRLNCGFKLLGAKIYGCEVDIWSSACVFGEMLRGAARFPEKNTFNQLELYIDCFGLPTDNDADSMNASKRKWKELKSTCYSLIFEFFPLNLYQYLKKFNRKIGLVETKMFAWQLFRGQYHLLRAGICHRDIKPQNLLIDEESGLLKIGDFGSSAVEPRKAPQPSYHVTRYYRPPELLLGAKIYGCEVDIWSSACFFFGEMLRACTRKAAFRVNIDGAMTTTTCTANGADPRDRCSGCCQSRALAAGLLTTDAAGFPSTNGNDCICCIFNKCSLR